MDTAPISTLWILICACEVALMQAGFLCLEAGLTRSKNNINVAVKNMADFGVSAMLFWLIGYAVMFGTTQGWLFTQDPSAATFTFFFFQLMFCGTAVTILSGSAAERLSFVGYIATSAVVAAVIYPVFGRLVWLGLQEGESLGLLARLGYIDFAGVSVVHMVGGWSALALILIIGPRKGRFSEDGQTGKIAGSNLPLAALGVMVLWVGWFGFNGGSALAFNDQVPLILTNTALAGMAGMVTVGVVSLSIEGSVEAEEFLNGPLAGLVSITGVVNAVSPSEAIIIGFIGALVAQIVGRWLIRMKIDDAVGAVSVHLGAGIWGTIAVALFGNPEILNTGLSFTTQLMIQLLGITVAFAWAFGGAYLAFFIINKYFYTLRVTPEAEMLGLNIHEHNARTDMVDMFWVMEEQAATGNLSLRVPEEPFTQVGQIARQYNLVMQNLENSVARVESILQVAQDGILTFSPGSWLIQSANPAACHLLGIPQDELTQYRFTDFLADNKLKVEQLAVDLFIEVNGRRRNGAQFPMQLAISKVQTADTLFYTAIFRDITDLQEYIQTLSEARNQAQQANRFKDQMMAMVGHELRTPIMAISGSAELIETGALGTITDAQKEFITQILDSSIHLNILVNDIIEQSHLQSGRVMLNTHHFEVETLVEQVCYPLERMAREQGLKFELSVDSSLPDQLFNDSTRLKQIIINLASNGIKYSDEGTVSVTLHDASDTHWQIIVKDTGSGIPEQEQDKIFNAFRQVEDVATRRQGGVGLGLAIVQQLVTLMRGSIDLQSTENKGTTITVHIPFISPSSNN